MNELEFWADYDIEEVSGGDEMDYEFCYQRTDVPAADELSLEVPSRPVDYFVCRVRPSDGEAWTGRFEPGVEGLSGIFATPSEHVCCVIVKGQAYWVPINDPADYQVVPSFPVKRVVSVPGKLQMVFVDYVRMVAYEADGIAWQTPDLSWDGIEIDEVTPQRIKGKAWDAPNEQHVDFVVDVNDGKCQGGSSPDLHVCQNNEARH